MCLNHDLTDFCSPKFKKSKFFLTVCVSVGFDFLFDDFLSTAFHDELESIL